MHNQLHPGKALDEAHVLLDWQQRAHSEQLETTCRRVWIKEMLDRHNKDMRNLEGLMRNRLHSLQSALDHKM